VKALALGTAAVAIVASLALPARADDEARDGYSPPHVVSYRGGTIPSYAHLEGRANWGFIDGGLWVTGVPYGLSVLYAMSTCGAQMDCRSGSQWLYVPVVGPFVTATQAPTTGGQALSVFDGALQSLGAVLMIAGVSMPHTVVVWQDESAQLRITPNALSGGAGLSVALTNL